MSQVHVEEIPHCLKCSVRQAELIVVVRDLQRTRIVKERVFPSATHHRREQETRYREVARQFEVRRVLKAKRQPAPQVGSLLDVWVEPAYGEEEVRLAHEQGITKSPCLLEAVPRSRPTGGQAILFLVPHAGIYRPASSSTDEGLGSLAEVEELVHGEANPTLWYLEDRSAFHRDGRAIVIGEDGTLFLHQIEQRGGPRLRERICQTRIEGPALTELRRLVEATDWSRLEFTGTLVPDETRPRLYIGLRHRRLWTIDPAPRSPGSSELPEQQAYQAILRQVEERCGTHGWKEKAENEIDFDRWPTRIREITQ